MSYKNKARQVAYQKQWAIDHLPERRSDRLARKHAKQDYVRQLKAVPCMDCHSSYPFWIMEFDHVRGEKVFCIGDSGFSSVTQEAMENEIAKCDIVCANCHRDRTWKRKNSDPRGILDSAARS